MIAGYNFLYENMGGYLAYFCYIFYVVGYLKRVNGGNIRKHKIPVFICTTLIIITGVEVISFISTVTGKVVLLSQLHRLHDSRNIITVVQSISLFYIFIDKKAFSSSIINRVSMTALGTYLITETISIRGEDGMTSILWNSIFHFSDWYATNTFPIKSLLAIIVVFCVAIIIDTIRIMLLKCFHIEITAFERLDNKTREMLE